MFYITGAIRCYCNMPECEETGYTCISHSEKCFSKLYTVYTKNNNTSSGNNQHGCIDLMAPPSGQDSLCDGTGDVVKQMKAFEPLIMCCSDSMCNYRENQDIRVDIIDTPMISSGNTHFYEYVLSLSTALQKKISLTLLVACC